MGLLSEVVPTARTSSGRSRWPRDSRASRSERMLADRRAAIEGLGTPLARGLALEAQAGPEIFQEALAGAARFAAGEGRGGAPVAAGAAGS